MPEPRVSICIPNYNNAKYLDQCIQSALAQTCGDVEVMVSDDASTDASLDVARKYQKDITLIRQRRNLGQPRNTNACVEASRGEYLVILHSDDQLLPEFVECLLPILERYERVGMAAGERLETNAADSLHGVTPFYDCNCIVPGEKQAKVFMMTAFVPCQVLVRRTTFEQAGGVHERHIVNLDGLLWFRCALQADFGYVRQPVCIYRKHPDSTTAQYNRTIGHMMEYYATLCEMFRAAAGRPYLEEHFDAAVDRTAALTLRYCHDVIADGNYELARRFLTLATVFTPSIANTHEFRALQLCISSPRDADDVYTRLFGGHAPVRTTSYAPPAGFQPLELELLKEVP